MGFANELRKSLLNKEVEQKNKDVQHKLKRKKKIRIRRIKKKFGFGMLETGQPRFVETKDKKK